MFIMEPTLKFIKNKLKMKSNIQKSKHFSQTASLINTQNKSKTN